MAPVNCKSNSDSFVVRTEFKRRIIKYRAEKGQFLDVDNPKLETFVGLVKGTYTSGEWKYSLKGVEFRNLILWASFSTKSTT